MQKEQYRKVGYARSDINQAEIIVCSTKRNNMSFKEKKMNLKHFVLAFLFGTFASLVFASPAQNECHIGNVVPETEKMEAVWYPE
mgnify:CR=1 FL=1